MDLLGDRNQDMMLEQILRFVEVKEAGKRSVFRLLLPQATDAATGSSYRRQKRPSAKDPPPKDQDTCTYCGTRGHGGNPPSRVRRIKCPAFGTKCSCCGKDHHFEKVCRSKNGTRPAKDTGHEDAILCKITSADNTKSTTLDCHVFDKFTKEWLRRKSKPQPYIRLQMSIRQEDCDHFGFPLRIPQKQSFVSAMADTGCQSCLAGLKIMKKLGLSTRDLIPVNIKMHAADNHNIRILGATILRLSGKNNKGEEWSTRQMIYVTNDTDKLFLSREACIDDQGIIPNTFPTMDEAEGTNPTNAIGATDTSSTGMSMPQTDKATTNSHLPTIPSHRSQQGETPAIPPRLLQFQHLQYL